MHVNIAELLYVYLMDATWMSEGGRIGETIIQEHLYGRRTKSGFLYWFLV